MGKGTGTKAVSGRQRRRIAARRAEQRGRRKKRGKKERDLRVSHKRHAEALITASDRRRRDRRAGQRVTSEMYTSVSPSLCQLQPCTLAELYQGCSEDATAAGIS